MTNKVDSARMGAVQTVAYTAASAPIGSAFGSQTYQVRLVASSACHIKIGDGAQTAAVTDHFLPANWIEYVSVTPGQRLAAIRAATGGLVAATDGTLWVSELTQ